MKIRTVLSLVAICSSGVSCGGSTATSQGPATGGDSGSDAGPVADDAANDAALIADSGPWVLPSLNDTCDGVPGLTGQSVLDALQAQYSATFTPVGTVAPTALTIRTHYVNGAVTCHPAMISNGGPPDMPAWVDVEVQIDFVAADGLFNETFTTPIARHTGTTLDWDGVVPAADIKGTYKPTLTGYPTINISFGGTFSGTTTSGVVVEQATNGSGGKVAGAGGWK